MEDSRTIFNGIQKDLVKLSSDKSTKSFAITDEIRNEIRETLKGLILDDNGEIIVLTDFQIDKLYCKLLSLIKTYKKCNSCVKSKIMYCNLNSYDENRCSGSFLHRIDRNCNPLYADCSTQNPQHGIEPLVLQRQMLKRNLKGV